MIKIGSTPIEAEYYITHQYDGNKILTFTILPQDKNYYLIQEETTVYCDNMVYTIKSIDEQDTTTVECALNFDDLKTVVFAEFTTTEETLSNTLANALDGTAWAVINADLVTIGRSLALTDVTPIAVVEACRDTYEVVYEIDTLLKTLTVIKPENIQPIDVYLTDQLNLRRVDFKGDSYEFCTRLYPYGVDGLGIGGVNGGVTYINNNDYSVKIISKVWRDERYTDPQSLKDAAIEYLKILAQPNRFYEIDVIDLAKLDIKYADLSFGLYDILTLIDQNRGTKLTHRVVEYVNYPLTPERNVVTLSTLPQRIEGIVNTVIANVSELNTGLLVEKKKFNLFKSDVDTNMLRIGEAYTTGETDTLLESKITQSKDEILLSVSENYTSTERATELEISITGVEAKFSQSGGGNTIKNSCGLSGLKYWASTGTVTAIDLSDTTAKKGLSIAGTAEQINIPVALNAPYLLCFKYRTVGTGVSVYNYSLNSETAVSLPISTAWVQVVRNYSFSQIASIKFASTSGTLIISDLLLMQGAGDLPMVWQQADNELRTSAVLIDDDGITMSRTGSDFVANYDNDSVEYKKVNEAVTATIAKFSVDGALMGDATITGTLAVSKMRTIPVVDGVFIVIDY